MSLESRNPATEDLIANYPVWSDEEVDDAIRDVVEAQKRWQCTSFDERAALLQGLARALRAQGEELARLATREMGKPLREARTEIEKCAMVLEFYAAHGERFLAEEQAPLPVTRASVRYEPLGLVLAIMPWNFPYWQVMRLLAPALMAGNAVVLKHAPNVQGCAMALERCLKTAGLPEALLRNFPVEVNHVPKLIAHPAVRAVAVTGSERTGRTVASLAGQHLKKLVLELGGSDPFIVTDDADLTLALECALRSRFANAGQACIAAKRFILFPQVAESFVAALKQRVSALRVGPPDREDVDMGPLARQDIREQCHALVEDALHRGAERVLGCAPLPGPGYFYAPSILDHVPADALCRQEELFGPVASVVRVKTLDEAIRIANETRFGLGASVFTEDPELQNHFLKHLDAGLVFANGVVKSDPLLPFGGIKASGYGRELSHHGIREFCQAKTVWVR
jgi:succinate-semialdehyde dehydrogenase/glutarate-semialdehyde dehydrogenase